jgi:hypothetical protein
VWERRRRRRDEEKDRHDESQSRDTEKFFDVVVLHMYEACAKRIASSEREPARICDSVSFPKRKRKNRAETSSQLRPPDLVSLDLFISKSLELSFVRWNSFNGRLPVQRLQRLACMRERTSVSQATTVDGKRRYINNSRLTRKLVPRERALSLSLSLSRARARFVEVRNSWISRGEIQQR